MQGQVREDQLQDGEGLQLAFQWPNKDANSTVLIPLLPLEAPLSSAVV